MQGFLHCDKAEATICGSVLIYVNFVHVHKPWYIDAKNYMYREY